MTDLDLAKIMHRLKAMLQALQRTDVLTTYYRERRVTVEAYSFTLTAAQRTTLQGYIDTATARILVAANGLEPLTGALGVPNVTEVAAIAAAPPRIYSLIGSALQSGQQILGSIPLDLAVDGAAEYTFDDNAAQMTANSLATIKEGVVLVVALIRARAGL